MRSACSPAQEALWLAEQAGEIGAANNLPLALELTGPLQVDVLSAAIVEVARVHTSLRTTFREAAGRLTREVGPEPAGAGVPLVPVDTSNPGAVVEGRSRVPVDILTAPWTVSLLRAGAESHLLLAVFHHAVFDGPSTDVFTRDLATAYAGLHRGTERPLGSVRSAAPERDERAIDRVRAAARAYWPAVFPKVAGALPFPSSPHRSPSGRGRAEAVRFELDPTATAALERTARACDVSVFVLLLSAVQLVQWLYAARRTGTIATGMPLGTRSGPERSRIGMFANEVPVWSTPDPALGFDGFARRVTAQVRALARVRDFPYELAVRELAPGVDPRALRPGMRVSYWKGERTNPDLPRLELRTGERLPVYGGLRTCFGFVHRRAISAGLEYDTTMLHPAGAGRMVEQLRQILLEVTDDPEVPLGEIAGLPPAERHTMLVEWNETKVDHPPGGVVELFAGRVRQHPDRVAAQHGGERVTFAELDARSDALAAALSARGCRPGVPIGLYLQRSLDLLAAVLAIFKCGAPYVPLDPRYPPDRLAYMLEDSRAALLLSQRGLAAPAAAPGPERVDLEDLPLAGVPFERRATPAHGDTAYVIYTSGSTGRPKGVALRHGGLLNLLHSMIDAPGIGPDDVFLAVTTLSFDIGTAELLAPLLAGARVVIAPAGASANGEAMASLLESTGATIAFATPTTWRLAVTAGWQGGHKVLVGGEPLTPGLAADLTERATEVWNLYGPTETTIFSTCARIGDPDAVPIGRPVANTRLYLQDEAGCVPPVGVAGDLLIAGAGVAGGYLRRDELTAERFPPNPFDGGATRVYRTGDLARYRDDGALEFVGRTDEQVKVRGNRIEPGEIEATLVAHPRVESAAVTAHGRTSSERTLVAYYVASDDGVAAEELGEFAAERLPAFMVPAAFVALDALPTTPNGKVDKARLPAPRLDAGRPAPAAPRNPLERCVADVWSEVLGRRQLDVDEDFFRAGGHSLSAAEVVAKVRERLGRHVPMRLIFDAPTIAGMAERLAAGSPEPDGSPLQPLPRGAAVPRP